MLFNRIFWREKTFRAISKVFFLIFFESTDDRGLEKSCQKKKGGRKGEDMAKDLYFQNRYYRLKSWKRLENALIRRHTFKIEIV